MSEQRIPGDPNSFAGESEHSHQVALFSALAQYRFWYEKESKEWLAAANLYVREDPALALAHENYERMARIAGALKWVHAVPNGGARGEEQAGSKKYDRTAMIRGGQMKAEGVKSGVSDIDVPFPAHGYHGFKIEMKAPGKLRGESAEQKEYGAWLHSCGYLYAVFDSWSDALKAIRWYLGIEAHPFEWSLPD